MFKFEVWLVCPPFPSQDQFLLHSLQEYLNWDLITVLTATIVHTTFYRPRRLQRSKCTFNLKLQPTERDFPSAGEVWGIPGR